MAVDPRGANVGDQYGKLYSSAPPTNQKGSSTPSDHLEFFLGARTGAHAIGAVCDGERRERPQGCIVARQGRRVATTK